MVDRLPDGGLQRLSSTATVRRTNVPPALHLSARSSHASLANSSRRHGSPSPERKAQRQSPMHSTTQSLLHPQRASISSQTESGRLNHMASYGSLYSSLSEDAPGRSESMDTIRGVQTYTYDTDTGRTSSDTHHHNHLLRYISGPPQRSLEELPITARSPFGSIRTLDFAGDDMNPPPPTQNLVLNSIPNQEMLSSVMHGVFLALQSAVMLAVFSALVLVTVWKHDESSSDFWHWLWNVAVPALGLALLICFTTLMVHETKSLSTVCHLYLQTGILLLTTVTAMAIVMHCFEQESRAVKGVLMGCGAMMWGLSFLGFVRTAVMWKFESIQEQRGESGDTITTTSSGGSTMPPFATRRGTFVLWDESRAGHD